MIELFGAGFVAERGERNHGIHGLGSSMPPMRCGLDQLREAKIEKNQIVGVVILVESGISQTSMLDNFNAYHMTLERA